MKLQTQVPLHAESKQIDYTSRVLLLGSCFAENMGEKLSYFKFQNLQNPFGIIFNPVSLQRLIFRAVEQQEFTEADVFEKEGMWYSFEAHSSLTTSEKSEYLLLLNKKLAELRIYMEQASHVVLTFGTAWVYREQHSGAIVANCHKIPQQAFTKELLTVDQVSEALGNSIQLLKELNKNSTVITTVSPVRHLKDGFVENNLSKSHLLAGLHASLQQLSQTDAPPKYFPAYEIMMDELREYRFYVQDMIHPNNTAIEIIWNHFNKVWVSSETEPLQKEVDGIQKGLQHRAFHPESDTHQAFILKLEKRITNLQVLLPHISFK